jgi:HEAT repeat protein
MTPQAAAPTHIGQVVTRTAPLMQPSPGPARSPSVPHEKSAGNLSANSASIDSAWISGATDGLIAALDDPSPQVRGEAAHSLGRLGAVRARLSLTRFVNDPDKYVQYEAREALSALDRAR